MLNSEEIFERLDINYVGTEPISIVPRPFRTEQVKRGGTSIDLRLGRWFVSLDQTRSDALDLSGISSAEQSLPHREHFIPFSDSFTLHPGRFALGITLEWLSFPSTLCGQVLGKSKFGRHGLIIETASAIHPNFTGCLTLELANVGDVPLKVFPGMQICQVHFMRTKDVGVRNRGSFSVHRKPAIKAVKSEKVFEALVKSKLD